MQRVCFTWGEGGKGPNGKPGEGVGEEEEVKEEASRWQGRAMEGTRKTAAAAGAQSRFCITEGEQPERTTAHHHRQRGKERMEGNGRTGETDDGGGVAAEREMMRCDAMHKTGKGGNECLCEHASVFSRQGAVEEVKTWPAEDQNTRTSTEARALHPLARRRAAGEGGARLLYRYRYWYRYMYGCDGIRDQ